MNAVSCVAQDAYIHFKWMNEEIFAVLQMSEWETLLWVVYQI